MSTRDLPPVHPGEILLEDFLAPMEISRYRLAKSIGVPQRRIDENMKESFGSLTVLPKIHLELERVNQRLDDLERRLSKLEQR